MAWEEYLGWAEVVQELLVLVVVVAVGGCHWVGCAGGGDCGSCFI